MKKKIPVSKIILVAVIAIVTVIAPLTSAYAAEGDMYANFYKANAKLLQNNNIILSALHSIGWLITKGLVELGNITQNLYDTAFGFIDLTDSASVNSFVSEFKIVFIALSCLALCYLGIILIMQPKKKPNVAINICFAVLCVTCSTWLFGTMNDLAHSFKTGVDNINGDTKQVAVKIVDNNMYDILKLYNENGTSLTYANAKTGARITDTTIDYIDINEVIEYDSEDLSNSENPFKYKVKTFNGKDGKPRIKPVYNGFLTTSLGNDFYYRYNFQYLSAWLQLASLLIVYITLSYKCVRIAFELVFGRLLAYLYSAELSGGEKIRKIIVFIRDSYILLAVSVICVKIYSIFTEYIGSNSKTQGLTGAVFSLFIAFAIIDGPNLVEKLLGMDAGLKSSTARMLAVGRASRAAALGAMGLGAKAGKGVGAVAGKINDKISNKIKNDDNKGGRQAENAMNENRSNNPGSSKSFDNSNGGINPVSHSNNSESAGQMGENESSSDSQSGNNYDFMNKRSADNSKSPNDFMNKDRSNSKETSMPKREQRSRSNSFDMNTKMNNYSSSDNTEGDTE
ncbi:pLS20_p028 family conjugation system transmembrane protein [Anaerofustis stercorihominis]|uniref:pLS20_p028 family conjugation system transmembrane protein n=1 Tax=Anaerofustis stercorihominis TaxID=214853 RepID=UPI00398458DC